jgi:hypothetical protein
MSAFRAKVFCLVILREEGKIARGACGGDICGQMNGEDGGKSFGSIHLVDQPDHLWPDAVA